MTLYFHSYLTGCRTEEGRISHVVIENKNGAEALVARYFIDATGDADLALRAGVPMQPAGTTLQPASLIFMLGGVDTDALPMLRHSRQGVNYHDLAIREALEAAARAGGGTPLRRAVVLRRADAWGWCSST